jgi:hypothetical protein
MRITDRAAAEAARLLSITPDEARALLKAWIAQVSTTQAGKQQESGCTEYRGPKPWRLMMLVDDNDVGAGHAVVAVRPSTSTRQLLNAPARTLEAGIADLRRQAAAAAAGRPVVPSGQPLDNARRPNTAARATDVPGRAKAPAEERTPEHRQTPSSSQLVRVEAELTQRQHAWCKEVCEARGTTISEWLRTLVADAMEDEQR